MIEIANIGALIALLFAAGFGCGWYARQSRIPPPPAKRRPIGSETERAATAAGRLGISMSALGKLLAEGTVRALPGGDPATMTYRPATALHEIPRGSTPARGSGRGRASFPLPSPRAHTACANWLGVPCPSRSARMGIGALCGPATPFPIPA
jgi:hypothetical protein